MIKEQTIQGNMAALKVRSKEEKEDAEKIYRSKTNSMLHEKPKYFNKPLQVTVKADPEENSNSSDLNESSDDQQ